MRTLILRTGGALCLLLLVVLAIPTSEHLSNTKSNRWVYVVLAGCQQKGLLKFHEGPQFRIYSTVTRTDVARAAVAAFNLLWWQVKDWQKRLDALPIGDTEVSISELRVKLDALKQEVVVGFHAKSPEMRGLIRISDEFEPELTVMGVDASAMRGHLEDMIPRTGHGN